LTSGVSATGSRVGLVSQSTIQPQSCIHIISQTGSLMLALPTLETRSELRAELMTLEFLLWTISMMLPMFLLGLASPYHKHMVQHIHYVALQELTAFHQ
jgi:hypothetical protein